MKEVKILKRQNFKLLHQRRNQFGLRSEDIILGEGQANQPKTDQRGFVVNQTNIARCVPFVYTLCIMHISLVCFKAKMPAPIFCILFNITFL